MLKAEDAHSPLLLGALLQVEPVLQKPASQVSELTLGDLLKQAVSSTGASADDEELLELLAARKDTTTGGWLPIECCCCR